jgi:formate C-acetyltransferase
LLDSMSIYAPDWAWLLERGLGGIAVYARQSLEIAGLTNDERSFLTAVGQAMESVSHLVRRYAEEAERLAASEPSLERRAELEAIAERCGRVVWRAPEGFIEAVQLIQIVHMVLSCLVGGRDVTPGRLDQYLLRYYQRDVASGALRQDDAAALLAMFFLRLSQMAGNATDFNDNRRRSPCKYSHLYVTVGGRDMAGRSCVNELSFVVADAIRLLGYKEPTLLVRYHAGMGQAFTAKVAGLVRDRFPVTIYNDETVIKALVRQGVPPEMACGYAHSACHNVLVPGHEAGSGPRFHNAPWMILLAMNEARAVETFEGFWEALRAQMRQALADARRAADKTWREQLAGSCPVLPSSLMKECLDRRRPAWQAATVSHWNHHLMGLATAVDSLLAIRELVFNERLLTLEGLGKVLAKDWAGSEALRDRIRRRLPRYGQGTEEGNAMASRLGRMWVEEVEAASSGMERMAMWPGFYSHMVHVWEGAKTPATPDGRRAGDPLSENIAPSTGSPGCSPTSVLRAMSSLPFDHTPSGAAVLSLSPGDLADSAGRDLLVSLIETYFAMGGLHVQVNTFDAATLEAAMKCPERYPDLMVRVTGFSAYFTQLSREVQEDVLRRHKHGETAG